MFDCALIFISLSMGASLNRLRNMGIARQARTMFQARTRHTSRGLIYIGTNLVYFSLSPRVSAFNSDSVIQPAQAHRVDV